MDLSIFGAPAAGAPPGTPTPATPSTPPTPQIPGLNKIGLYLDIVLAFYNLLIQRNAPVQIHQPLLQELFGYLLAQGGSDGT